MCFLDQFARNVTILLVEKQELCDNVIGEHVLEDIGFADTAEDMITDFTIVGFQFLVVLIRSQHLVVFDCQPLLCANSRTANFMLSQLLEGKDQFNRVEALEEGIPQSVLVLGKQAS